MIASVAHGYGSLPELVARRPFGWTLFAFQQLQAREREAGERRRAEALQLAIWIATGYHNPPQLVEEAQAHATRTRALPSRADARAHGQTILAAAIAAGWVPDASAASAEPAAPSEVHHA